MEGLVANSGNPNSYVGDLQGVSNLATPFPHIARLYKAYYRQTFDPFTLRVGLINPNDYFNTIGVASELFNASFGVYPTITLNIPYTPVYPYSSLGVMGSYQVGDTTVQFGIFNADGYTPFRRPWLSEGQIYYGEIDQNINCGPGAFTLKAGGYYNHVTSEYLKNPDDPNAALIGTSPSQGGFYGTAEYRWKSAGIDWGSFLEVGGAPNSSAISPVNGYVAAGMRVRNFITDSSKSTLSVGFDRAWKRQNGAETAIEINFRQPVFSGFYLQPDLQYVINPGANAAGSQIPNAVVGILRIGWRGSLSG